MNQLKFTMDLDGAELESLGYEKVLIGKDLNEKLNSFKNIHGVSKIQKKIICEVASLQKVKKCTYMTDSKHY